MSGRGSRVGAAGEVALVRADAAVEPTSARSTRGDLPVMLGEDPDRVVDLVPVVRLLGGMSGALGVLAISACIAMGQVTLAVVAVLMSGLILYALWEDTRLANSLELLRRRKYDAAEASLARIAESTRRSPWQRQRARTYLAALAWRRGDIDQALLWVEARLASPQRGRYDRWQHWLTQATQVQLLALLGRGAEATQTLRELAALPRNSHARHVYAETALLVAFMGNDPESVRERLDEWEPRIRRSDRPALGLGLLAWANAERGERDRALSLVDELRTPEHRKHLTLRYPRLWQWIERYDDRFHPGR